MNRPIVVVGITVVGLAVVLGGIILLGKRKSEVAVQLVRTDGKCKVAEPVETLQGSWLRSKLTWNVTNNCTDQVVAIKSFRKRVDGSFGQTEDDLVEPIDELTIRENETKSMVTHIKKIKWSTYKYDICLGKECTTDPDVDVWPF